MGSVRDALSSTSSTTSSGGSTTGSTRTIRSIFDHGRLTNGSSTGRGGLLTPHPTLSTLDSGSSQTRTPPESPSTPVLPNSPALSSRSDGEKWSIYFSKRPRTANLTRGPFSWSDLQHIFSLDEQTMAELQRLESDKQLRMRVLILQNVAFVYDPIFAESGKTTYLVDWGRRDENENIMRYIEQSKYAGIYHTFVFPRDTVSKQVCVRRAE
ncbi:hypothetical protein AX15_002318 [Amanita polypyramis BW_CC]|nr:hypothetical protein AX15_002318 [Amanita polypyramis BW_CC]